MTIPPEILTAAELRCDVAGIWALAIAADPTGRQARREILTAALEEAAPLLAATGYPRCPTLCDADCEKACHEAHAPRQQQDHNPETCVATIVAAAVAAERLRIWAQPVVQRLELHGDGSWNCAGCCAPLTENAITHEPRCSEIRLAALIGETP